MNITITTGHAKPCEGRPNQMAKSSFSSVDGQTC